jgi:hypothetical protein
MAGFPHRRNSDDSFDAICPECFKTVASGRKEVNLAIAEMQHICDPADLLERQTKLLNYQTKMFNCLWVRDGHWKRSA